MNSGVQLLAFGDRKHERARHKLADGVFFPLPEVGAQHGQEVGRDPHTLEVAITLLAQVEPGADGNAALADDGAALPAIHSCMEVAVLARHISAQGVALMAGQKGADLGCVDHGYASSFAESVAWVSGSKARMGRGFWPVYFADPHPAAMLPC